MTGESFNLARRSTGQPLLDIPPPMFSVATNQIESFSNLGRRELLRIGGLTALGLSLFWGAVFRLGSMISYLTRRTPPDGRDVLP